MSKEPPMNKSAILFLCAVTMLLVLVGCAPPALETTQITTDFRTQKHLDENITLNAFTITRRVQDEEAKTERVYVKVDSQDAYMQTLCYYEMSYFYDKSEGGWVLSAIDEEDTEMWEKNPLTTPDIEMAREFVEIHKKDLGIDSSYTLEGVTLTDAGEMDANMRITNAYNIYYGNDLVTYTTEMLLDWEFAQEDPSEDGNDVYSKNGWHTGLFSCVQTDCAFKPDKAPNVDADMVVAMLENRRIDMTVDYWYERYLLLQPKFIKYVVIDSITPKDDGTLAVCEGNFLYDTEIADIRVQYTLELEPCDDGGVIYRKGTASYTVENVHIAKEWRGIYSDGKMGFTLDFTSIKATGELEAVFSFYPMPSNTSGKSGSYKMTGKYTKDTMRIELDGKEWIDKPPYYYMIDIDGLLNPAANAITSEGNKLRAFPKSIADKLDKTPMIHDELGILTDTEIKELQKAIDTIYKKRGVGAELLLTNTTWDGWNYLCAYSDSIHGTVPWTDDYVLYSINTGNEEYSLYYNSGWSQKDKNLRDYSIEKDSDTYTYFNTYQFAKSFQAYLYGLNRYLGGKDSDLTFSW